MTSQEIDYLIERLDHYHSIIDSRLFRETLTQAIACIRELQAELADARKMAETQCQIRYAETEEKERLQRENAELREAVYGKSDLLPALKQEELRRCLEKAGEIIASWPAWKQGILQHSSEPTNKEPRKPIGND